MGKKRSTEKTRKIRVGAVQMIAEKYNPEANITKALAFCDRAAKAGVQYLCFPECAATGFDWTKEKDGARKVYTEPVPGPMADRFAEKARDTGMYIIMGMVERKGKSLYNTAFLVGPEEGYIGRQRKVLAERVFRSGTEANVFDTRFARIGIFICADMRSPELSRLLVLKGAHVLFQPTAYFYTDNVVQNKPKKRNIGKCVSQRSRAMENGVHLIMANIGRPDYVNNSRIIKPYHQGPEPVLARATRKEQLLTAEIEFDPGANNPRRSLERSPEIFRELGKIYLDLTS